MEEVERWLGLCRVLLSCCEKRVGPLVITSSKMNLRRVRAGCGREGSAESKLSDGPSEAFRGRSTLTL